MKLSEHFSPTNISLVREMVISDFKLRYKNSVLGYLWSLLRPLMLFGVLYYVFTQVIPLGKDIPHYPQYLLLGIVIWTFFVESTMSGLNAITSRSDLVRKVSIHKYIIVVSTTLSAFVNFSLNMVVVFVFMVIGRVPLRAVALTVPFLVVELFILGLGIALLLSALFVKYRDFVHIWEVALQVLFYATPIIYPLTKPTHFQAQIMSFSPITQIIQDFREALITPVTLNTREVIGSWMGLLYPVIVMIVICLVGVVYFKKSAPNFAEDL